MAEGGGASAAASLQGSNSSSFVEGWEFMQTLGEGAYGEVKLAVCKESGDCVAVKIVTVDGRKEGLSHESLRKEVCILKMLRHSNVIKFFGQRTQGNTHYLLLEYADGGELFDRIEPDLRMEPGQAHHFFLQILSGVEYLHSRGVDMYLKSWLDFADTVCITRKQFQCYLLSRRCEIALWLAVRMNINT